MNVPVAADGSVRREPPSARPGDYVTLTAQCDLLLVMSACPQDLTPINGIGRTPSDVQHRSKCYLHVVLDRTEGDFWRATHTVVPILRISELD